MIEEVTMHAVDCDGCGRRRYQELHPEVEPPLGFIGTITEHTTYGGRGAHFYACRERCLGKAALTAVRRDQQEPLPGLEKGGRP